MNVEKPIRPKPLNDIRLCHKCKHMNVQRVQPILQEMAPDSRIRVGCKSYCGPCDRYAFIYINGRYVTGETEAEAIVKARKYVKHKQAAAPSEA